MGRQWRDRGIRRGRGHIRPDERGRISKCGVDLNVETGTEMVLAQAASSLTLPAIRGSV